MRIRLPGEARRWVRSPGLWLLFLGVVCAPSSRSVRAEAPLARQLFSFSDQARAELGLPIPTAAQSRSSWEGLVARCRARCEMEPPNARSACLLAVLFEGWGLEREVADPSLGHALLPGVIRARRGSCLGLSALFLALAEALSVPAAAVLVPGHVFVRLGQGARGSNAELFRQGETLPDSWYVQKYHVPPGVRSYLRPLTPEELLAVFWFNLGNALRERGRALRALEVYAQVLLVFPGFAEAQANAGLAYHLLDRPAEAFGRYARAWEINPALTGLSENLGALLGETGRLLPWLFCGAKN